MQPPPNGRDSPARETPLDEPRIELGSRSVPLSEWEGEILVQAAACVLLIRAFELSVVSLFLAPFILYLHTGILGNDVCGCRCPPLWVVLPPVAAIAMWDSAGGLLLRQARARVIGSASLLGWLGVCALARGSYIGASLSEPWARQRGVAEAVMASLRVVPDLVAALALWGAPASRIFAGSGDAVPLSPLTSVPSAPRSVRGWVACGIVSLAALSLPCSLPLVYGH